jgi:hypothetical protein
MAEAKRKRSRGYLKTGDGLGITEKTTTFSNI